jgi:hypothetical protein
MTVIIMPILEKQELSKHTQNADCLKNKENEPEIKTRELFILLADVSHQQIGDTFQAGTKEHLHDRRRKHANEGGDGVIRERNAGDSKQVVQYCKRVHRRAANK